MNQAQVFCKTVEDKGRSLRLLTYEQIAELRGEPTEVILLGKQEGTISIIVEHCEGAIKAVVQGFLDGDSLKWLKHVALDSFYNVRTVLSLRCDARNSMNTTSEHQTVVGSAEVFATDGLLQ